MPLSFGEWPSRGGNKAVNFDQPCCSRGIVGKRKLTTIDDVEWPVESFMPAPEKRLCLIAENPFIQPSITLASDNHPINNRQEENNNNNDFFSNENYMESQDMEMTPQSSRHHNVPITATSRPHQLIGRFPGHDHGVGDSSTNQRPGDERSSYSTKSDDHLQTDDYIMDINDDESYAVPPTASTDQSETVLQSSNQSQADSTMASNRHVVHAQFCRDFCGSGSISPRSGHVRCYCKPSWEGMMGVSPYFSDIY